MLTWLYNLYICYLTPNKVCLLEENSRTDFTGLLKVVKVETLDLSSPKLGTLSQVAMPNVIALVCC